MTLANLSQMTLALLPVAAAFVSPTLRAAPSPRISHIHLSGLEKLSVGELKSLLADRGVDFRDCLEKRDLVERLESSETPSGSASRAATVRSALTESEVRTVDVFRRVSPAVAYIQVAQLAPAGFSLRPMEYPAGAGSGFVWDDQGHLVTNYHVIAGGQRVGGGELPRRVKVRA